MNNQTHEGCTGGTATRCPGCVRLAEPADEDALVAMVQAMHSDAEWMLRAAAGEPFPFNAEKARATIQRAIIVGRNDPNAGQAWIGVVGEGSKLRGSTYILLQSPWCADGQYLVERWNWVYPEYRKSDVSKSLIGFSTAMADHMHMTLVSASLPKEISAKSRLYERKIGPPIGSLFQYNSAVGAA